MLYYTIYYYSILGGGAVAPPPLNAALHMYVCMYLKMFECTACMHTCTVNRKIFIVKIFSESMGSAKIKHVTNTNAVWGRLSENYSQKLMSRNSSDLQ